MHLFTKPNVIYVSSRGNRTKLLKSNLRMPQTRFLEKSNLIYKIKLTSIFQSAPLK
jgi:hypothetical protein